MSTDKRRKIHFVHLTSAPGGLEVLLPRLIRALPDCDFKAFVIRPHPLNTPDVYEGAGIDRKYGSLNNVLAAARLFRYARENRKDIFHVFSTGPLFLLALRVAGAKRIVYSIHGTLYWKNSFQRIIMRALWRLSVSDGLVVTSNSDYSRQVFLSEVLRPQREIEIICNPVDIEAGAANAAKKADGLLTIGYAGRLVAGKNLDTWLTVAQRLSDVFSNARFVLYGDGVLKDELIKLAEGLGISDRVSFRGFIRDVAFVLS